MKAIPQSAIVCDDIRLEASGKQTIIGVYTGDILVSSFPCTLRLCTWTTYQLRFDGEQQKNLENRIRIVFEDSNIKAKELTAEAVIESHETEGTDTIDLPQQGAVIEMPCEGTILISGRPSGGRWKEVLRKRVRLNEEA